jgi:hypothetical protein
MGRLLWLLQYWLQDSNWRAGYIFYCTKRGNLEPVLAEKTAGEICDLTGPSYKAMHAYHFSLAIAETNYCFYKVVQSPSTELL